MIDSSAVERRSPRPVRGWAARQRAAPFGWRHVSTGARPFERKREAARRHASSIDAGTTRAVGYEGQSAYDSLTVETRHDSVTPAPPLPHPSLRENVSIIAAPNNADDESAAAGALTGAATEGALADDCIIPKRIISASGSYAEPSAASSANGGGSGSSITILFSRGDSAGGWTSPPNIAFKSRSIRKEHAEAERSEANVFAPPPPFGDITATAGAGAGAAASFTSIGCAEVDAVGDSTTGAIACEKAGRRGSSCCEVDGDVGGDVSGDAGGRTGGRGNADGSASKGLHTRSGLFNTNARR